MSDMTDNITLPREVVERARKALKPLDHYMTVYDRDEIADTLRAHLAAPRPEPVFDGQSGHPVMLPRAPVPVLGLISDEARAALKAADAVESQEAYRTRAALVAAEKEQQMFRDGWRQCAKGQRTTQYCGLLDAAVEAERESCAKLADEFYREGMDYDVGAAIRARKQKVPE